jgi:DNA-binding NtrC family response regulator
VIFADIVLEDKTGIDVLRKAKERQPLCPVVMITAYPDLETTREALRLGAFDYLVKPVQKDSLLRVANIAAQHKTLVDEKERYRSNLEAIFGSVKDTIITVNDALMVTEVNAAGANICGFSRDLINKDFRSQPLNCNKKCLEALEKAIQTKQPVELSRIECAPKNRPGRVVTVTTSPLLSRPETFAGAVMLVRDETHLVSLEREVRQRRQFHHIVGKSETMQNLYASLGDLSGVDTTVLITGESGTGKELVAEALHYGGERRNHPLVKVNCSALSENLMKTELFGHVKGAFTGAVSDKVGRFQRAAEGTIFLDEIGDVSANIQLRLLRVLQEKEIERVGDATPIKIDVRIVAATNQDLREKVRDGKFRQDLYYRLKVVEITLPPLRERREDIPLLVEHFLRKYHDQFHNDIKGVSSDVLQLFMEYPWPGNVRELQHALEHACILCHQSIVTVNDLPSDLKEIAAMRASSFTDRKEDETETIRQALEKTGGNKAKAARLLGISRLTLYRKMEKLDLRKEGRDS